MFYRRIHDFMTNHKWTTKHNLGLGLQCFFCDFLLLGGLSPFLPTKPKKVCNVGLSLCSLIFVILYKEVQGSMGP
jgi:hypothetical protein